MKRVCRVLAATAVLGLIISGTIFADEYGDFSYTVREDNTIVIDGYSGQDETVTVPDQIDGKTVVRIESNAFEYSGICSLSLPSTITEIGSNVFYGCENLTEVFLPDALTEADSYSFDGWNGHLYSNLGSGTALLLSWNGVRFNVVGYPDVSLMYEYEYNETSGMDELTGELDAFAWNNEITYAGIPEGVTRIGNGGFQDCGSLTNVQLPNSLKEIRDYGFDNCYALTEINLPESLKHIGRSGFDDCSSLTELILPEGLEYIGGSAFLNCNGMESLSIPDSVTKVENGAFDEFQGRVYISLGSTAAYAVSGNGKYFNAAGYPNVNLMYEYEYNETSGMDEPTGELDAFAWNNEITYAGIPEGVTRIGDGGFQDCGSLTNVQLPNSLKEIRDYGFDNCYALTEINLPENLKHIGRSGFDDCSSLTELILPEGLEYIGGSAFLNCNGMESLSIPDSVTEVDPGVFDQFEARIYANLNSSGALAVSRIEKQFSVEGYPTVSLMYEFVENETTSVKEPTGELDVFAWNNEIESIEIPEGVTRIAAYGFCDCDHLTKVELPDSVTRIGTFGFQDCDILTSVTLSDSLLEIGTWAFDNCYELSEIVLPSGLKRICRNAFDDCENLIELILPDGLEYIGFEAFIRCNNLTSLMIPNGVTEVEPGAFNGYDGQIFVEQNNIVQQAVSCDGLYFSLPDYPNISLQYEYVWNDTTQTKEPTGELDAFAWNKELTVAVIPQGVTRIGAYGFQDCYDLAEVELPQGVTSICGWAFQNCDALTEIELPAGVTHILEYGFQDCDNLESAVLPDSVVEIGNWAFDNCYKLVETSLPAGLKRIGQSAFDDCQQFTELILPDGLEYIGKEAFIRCYKLTSLMIPDSVTEIESDTFYGFDGTIYANIGSSGAKAIGKKNYSFFDPGYSNVKLQYQYNTDELIALDAFAKDTSIQRADIPSGVTRIPTSAFEDCGSLVRVMLPASVESIENHAFKNCTALTSITLPFHLTGIGKEAFYGCISMRDLHIPDSVTSVGTGAFGNNQAVLYAEIDGNGAKALGKSDYYFHVDGNQNVKLRYRFSDNIVSSLEAVKDNNNITIAEIPEGVTALPANAFTNCRQLRVVVIPDTAQQISVGAFSKMNETLVVGCTSAARTWAVGAGYPRDTEGGTTTYKYSVEHRDEQIDPAVAPTCTETGLTEGLHCNACGETIVPQEVVDALGHDWGEPSYTWAADFSSVTATRVCQRDAGHTETETVQTMSQITLAPTCETIGQTTYTSDAFTNEAFEVQSRTETDVPALGHIWEEPSYSWAADFSSVTATRVCQRDAGHTETEMVQTTSQVTLAATCEEMGQTTYTTKAFTNGAFEVQSRTETDVPALGHDWREPSYTWAADLSSVTATRVCRRDSSHTETETVQTMSQVTLAATCEDMGQTTYTTKAFTNGAFEVQSRTETDVSALGHIWEEPSYTWAADLSSVTATRVCQRDSSHTETETVQTTSQVTLAATCEDMGQTTYTTKAFTNGAFEVQSRTETDVPALGHDWGVPSYTWSQDNSSVTATRVCRHNNSHKETETAAATWALFTSPTDTTKGERRYTSASFTNTNFSVQNKTVADIPALQEMDGLKLPAMMRNIEEEAFAGGAFEYVIIPDGCETIGNKAFANCTNLIYIRIPAGVQIPADAFDSCSTSLIIDQKSEP